MRGNENAGRNWNSKPCHRYREPGLIYVFRKLEKIDQELVLFVQQGETIGFLAKLVLFVQQRETSGPPANIENTIIGLVEDIRQVVMDHQVRALAIHSFYHA